MKRLTNQTAIITGAATGLGAAIARSFIAEGANVGLLDLNLEEAETIAEQARAAGQNAMALRVDVSDEISVQEAFTKLSSELGSAQILVNNAGIDTTSYCEDMELAMWEQMMAVNLRSVFLCTRAALPAMKERKYGRVISIASQLAQKGAPRMTHYCAAKAGVIGFTRALAYEVGPHGITANAICPGPLDTELFRNLPEDFQKGKINELVVKRIGRVEEIAPTAVLLASSEGAFYTGATLNPNGGDIMV